jgi:hypothetical protein
VVIAMAFAALGAPNVVHSEGMSGSVSVTAAIQGVHVVVVGENDQIDQVWSNTPSADAAVVFRAGAVNGPELLADPGLSASFDQLASTLDWSTRRGLVWRR